MRKYFERFPDDDERAIRLYRANIQLSESFYSLLSMYEVALRNSLNRELTEYFETEDWYLQISNEPGLKNLNANISTAKRHIAKRDENITANKVIAELTLGFWVRLFNAEYERILWKPLRRAFPYMPKNQKQRKNVSAPINKIRDFRNRVFHHEPIAWNLERLEETYERILTVMGWLNKDLPMLAEELERASEILAKEKRAR